MTVLGLNEACGRPIHNCGGRISAPSLTTCPPDFWEQGALAWGLPKDPIVLLLPPHPPGCFQAQSRMGHPSSFQQPFSLLIPSAYGGPALPGLRGHWMIDSSNRRTLCVLLLIFFCPAAQLLMRIINFYFLGRNVHILY
jgi:hypothetical protein